MPSSILRSLEIDARRTVPLNFDTKEVGRALLSSIPLDFDPKEKWRSHLQPHLRLHRFKIDASEGTFPSIPMHRRRDNGVDLEGDTDGGGTR